MISNCIDPWFLELFIFLTIPILFVTAGVSMCSILRWDDDPPIAYMLTVFISGFMGFVAAGIISSIYMP